MTSSSFLRTGPQDRCDPQLPGGAVQVPMDVRLGQAPWVQSHSQNLSRVGPTVMPAFFP